MSDIQRWDFFGEVGINEPVRYLHLEAVKGRYVTYVDHEAEIASVIVSAAEVAAEAKKEGYRLGVLDGNADTSAKLQDYYGEQAQGHYMDGYKMGYAKGLIEGDSGGRKEGFRVGYDTAWSLSAAEIERQVREEEQVAQSLAVAESFAAGVKAARDAVAGLPVLLVDVRFNPDDASRYVGAVNVSDALAAIDGLTNGKKEA